MMPISERAADVVDVGRYRVVVLSDRPITFGGLLDRAATRGFVAHRMARGELAGDSRDLDCVRVRASGIAADITPAEPTAHRST